jgi:hypothetical protein
MSVINELASLITNFKKAKRKNDLERFFLKELKLNMKQ